MSNQTNKIIIKIKKIIQNKKNFELIDKKKRESSISAPEKFFLLIII